MYNGYSSTCYYIVYKYKIGDIVHQTTQKVSKETFDNLEVSHDDETINETSIPEYEDYEETDNVGIITKVIGNHILGEIDGESAIDKYVKWTNKDEKDLKGNKLLRESVLRPFGVKDV